MAEAIAQLGDHHGTPGGRAIGAMVPPAGPDWARLENLGQLEAACPDLRGWIAIGLVEQGDLYVELWDENDYLIFASPAARRLFPGRPSGPLGFADMLRWCHATGLGLRIEAMDFEAWLADVISRRRVRQFRQFASDFYDGTWILFSEVMLPNGWMLALGHDVTQFKLHEELLRNARDTALHASRTDALTELPNRRYTLELARAALSISPVMGAATALAMVDLDHFKRINDAYGHAVGDDVLRHFATHCRSVLRTGDLVGRVGGEEFLLLLPQTDADDALAVLRRLQETLMPCPSPSARQAVSYHFSAGVAMARPGESLEALFRRADHALYRAKRRGRNRIDFDSEGGAVPAANSC